MHSERSIAALNRIFVALYRSLPMYLEFASPWMHRGDVKAMTTLRHVINDQKALCQRIADFILERHGRIETSDYPMTFTSLHDCGLDFLISKVIESERRDIQITERAVADLHEDPPARSLAEEVLGALRGHLESLEELGDLAAEAPPPR